MADKGSEITEDQLKSMSPEQIAELQRQNCIFCKIISGEIPSKRVYEDELCICILDINPASEGHVLVLPKKHYQILPQIPEETISNLFLVAKEISHSILKAFGAKGTNIFVANGGVAGQRAPHFMIHVFQREESDGIFKNQHIKMPENDISKLKKHLMPHIRSALGAEEPEEPEEAEELPENLLDDGSIDDGLVRALQESEESKAGENSEDDDAWEKPEEKRKEKQGKKLHEDDFEESDIAENGDDELKSEEDEQEESENEAGDDLPLDTDNNVDLDKIGELFK